MIASDPSQTVDVHHPDDDDKPEESRPTFVYRCFTVRDEMERERLAAETKAPGLSRAEYADRLGRLLGVGLRGWRNLADPDGKPVAYEPDKPGEALRALSDQEAWDILNAASLATVLTEQKKRLSRTPSTTVPANSAPPAPQPASA